MNENLTALLLKFLKFGVVGATGLVIDFTITFLLKEQLKVNKYVSNSIGFIVAASTNYFFNRIWTFGNTQPNISIQYFIFIVISLIGLFLSTAIVGLLHERMKLNFYWAKLIAIGVVMSWNFTANLLFTFR